MTHSSTNEPSMMTTTSSGGISSTGVTGSGLSNGIRQLTKIRRFLTTLQQFASDINPEVGDRVRNLILSLLSGSVSVEEFHSSLQEVTHFPLRPFVLPFLRTHSPLLTRELHILARRAGMSISQYISLQEPSLLEVASGEATDFFSSEATNNKRKIESYLENGDALNSTTAPVTNSTSTSSINLSINGRNINSGRETSPSSRDSRASIGVHDDEWKNIHMMLTCILSMVEKTRRALTILQQREDRDIPSSGVRCSSTCSSSGEGRTRSDYDVDVQRHANELVADVIRSTEERVAEVKRKAEEAVIEVRKAAIVEVQRAAANAECKAQEMVNAERNRIEGLLRELARKETPTGEQKIDIQQACWNCGRKAQDTCSGCNIAKYCSSFCQHKDWDLHHKVCSASLATKVETRGDDKVTCKVHKTQDFSNEVSTN